METECIRNLTNSQLQCFKQFKERIEELHGPEEVKDIPRLLRFLVARDYDVIKATTMLSNSIKWRKKHSVDDLVNSYKPLEVLEKYFPAYYIGFSKEGDVIAYINFGTVDLIGLAKSAQTSDFVMHLTSLFEFHCRLLQEESHKRGKLLQTWIYILDFDKMSLSQVTSKDGMNLIISLLPVYEANYPERLKNAFIINASTAFTIAYAIVKPLLYEKTRNKIKTFGKTGWQEELTKLIDPEVLPVFLSGTRTNTVEEFSGIEFGTRGGFVPQRYYKNSNSKKNISTKPGVKKYLVPRLSRCTITAEVPEEGSVIEWEFQTENYEIGFGLRYMPKSTESIKHAEVMMPVQKMDTRVFCETGIYLCERPGTYIIEFDNSFSWFRSKELYVKADIVKPDGQRVCITT